MFQYSKIQRFYNSVAPPTPLVPLSFSSGRPNCDLDNNMAVKQDSVDYIVKHDFRPEQALELATKLPLIDITTVKDFVGYSSGHHEGPTVFKCWSSIPE